VVRVLIGLAGEMLGPSPFRIGAPPKALLPLSTAAPFEKISGRWWALPGENWQDAAYAPHRIEILCDGQQYIAYARHPRGTFYRWARGEPMDTYRVDLPEIDQAKATAFLSTAETVLRDVGAVPLKRMNRIYYPDLAQPERQKPFRRRRGASGPSDWQLLDPETLAKRIDAKHARRLRGDGWITSCPAHNSGGHRSLSITPREGGGSVVHCFADCSFVEVAREIGRILGAA
jgi:hypothetical protein